MQGLVQELMQGLVQGLVQELMRGLVQVGHRPRPGVDAGFGAGLGQQSAGEVRRACDTPPLPSPPPPPPPPKPAQTSTRLHQRQRHQLEP